MGKMEVIPGFKKMQYNIIAPLLCAPIWKWFMDACLVAGLTKIEIPCGSQNWTAPKIQEIDPLKETKATIEKLDYGLTSFSEVQRENGNDPDDMIAEIKSDQNKFKKEGIIFPLYKGNINSNSDGTNSSQN